MAFTHDSHRLMGQRVHEILLVSSPYELYIMEEEGLLADRISDEYSLLHLTNAPAITRVSAAGEALAMVKEKRFDLVITGTRVGKAMGVFDMAKSIKAMHPELPVALVTPESWRIAQFAKRRETSGIDKAFYWHGDTRLFLAIIKMFEDSVNAERDCLEEQVRAIILVEDSPAFYSAYLPLIYTEILQQTRALISEGVSDEEKLRRLSSRPKILMAESYEEAVALYNKYRANLLGIISDVRFPRGGAVDPQAGFFFTELVKGENPDVPVLLQSQDTGNAARAQTLGASFADKNSPHLLHGLRTFIQTYFGFGDFVFRMPDGTEVVRAHRLREMEEVLAWVPEESIDYHSRRNHFSNWLFARGEFELAAKLKPMQLSDFASIENLRQMLRRDLKATRIAKRKGTIARFSERDFDLAIPFIRFGEGSIGGKGRGIAFMARLLADPDAAGSFDGQRIIVPQTAAIGTDVFDRFLDRNRLHKVAMEASDDEEIARSFLAGQLEQKQVDELASFLKRIDQPLAVRSSSLSEDSLSQPFAGLYTTYFIPNNNPDFGERLNAFLNAIKLVYASTFFANPKAYMEANRIAIEGEKMAVLVQQVVGRRHGNYYYPDMAGVAQSYNYFPVGYLKPEDGVAELVMGLGTMAVRGGNALRFSPRHPGILPQFGRARDIVARSQREFHALDLTTARSGPLVDEGVTLATLDLGTAEEHGLLKLLGGVYSTEDDIIYEGLHRPGKRVLTFKKVIDESAFPLPAILDRLLDIGSHGMGCAVEIEFAANLPIEDEPASFAFLQVRPLVSSEATEEVDVESFGKEACVATTHRAMGNGVFDNISNLVYVKPEAFDPLRTAEIAAEIGRLNAEMVAKGETYILLGFGRWGTVNPRLGLPVTYAQVSHAKVIGEISTPEMDVEPSQGTHFFHNISSSHIGYLSIDVAGGPDFVDWQWLADRPATAETGFIKHIRLSSPIVTRIDGRSGRGVILKPIS
ncbi:MAG: PEP/pyruvate-binding domain-containing protein [Pseudomonadota bacterium]